MDFAEWERCTGGSMAAATVELGTTYLVGLVGLTQIADAL
jgi:hypothetical protein